MKQRIKSTNSRSIKSIPVYLCILLLVTFMVLQLSACRGKETDEDESGCTSSTQMISRSSVTQGMQETRDTQETRDAKATTTQSPVAILDDWEYDDGNDGDDTASNSSSRASTDKSTARIEGNGSSAKTNNTKAASASTSSKTVPSATENNEDIYTSKPAGFIF